MTSSDQPADKQLTRRQLREIRMTGATPIVTPEAAAEAAAQSAAAAQTEPETSTEASPAVESPATPAEPVAVETPAEPPLHLPRAAEPIVESPAPVADAAVDLGVRARTRRQARDQERIRTNSIPVLTPEAGTPIVPADEPTAADEAPEAVVPEDVAAEAPVVAEATPEPAPVVPEPVVEPEPVAEPELVVPEAAPVASEPDVAIVEPVADESAPEAVTEAPSALTLDPEPAAETPESQWAPRAATGAAPIPLSDPNHASESIAASMATSSEPEADDKHQVRADFGSALLTPAESFDDLLVRSSTSSGSAGSASMLVLPEDVSLMPLTAPVTSTGQVILTGTFALPEGLGSQGHAPGIADGKDVDAVLIDGELAPQSSPTPIAAIAAVSQAKTPVEMIRPPAPEKSSKLVVALAITAGLLSLAAIGFTIYVVTTGKF
ncbi:hypothetical protein ACQUSY_08045 [Microbacterium sp. YY-03]|uniref:hypothetical protein n=1 Tax=Microbacterium sp. YY-03 TaxID=3421636 RepID=UPI003D16D497